MERHTYINGVKVIRYEPTPLESTKFNMNAKRIRKRIEKELNKPVSKKRMQEAYRELLEITEGYDLQSRSDLNY